MPEPCECPTRKALESFAKIEIPHGCADGTWVATTRYCNDMVTAFQIRQARAALSAPCPCDQLRADLAEALEALKAITRIPVMPFPDRVAHSERAFADAVYRAWCAIQDTADAILAKHPEVKA